MPRNGRHPGRTSRPRAERRDVAVFAASLLLAFSIWLIDNLTQSYSATLRAVVTARSNIPGRFETSIAPVAIEARCRTSGFKLLRNRRAAHKPPVTVRFAPEAFRYAGDDVYTLSASELGGYVDKIFGADVLLESFVSGEVSFRFAEENSRKVPVTLVQAVTFKPQYMAAGEVRVEPDSVLIYGEQKYIERFDRILTRPLELTGISASHAGVVQLERPKGVRLSDESVSYHLDVARYVEVRRSVKVMTRGVPAGRELSVFPSVAELVIRCEFPSSGEPEEDVYVYIDYKDFNGSRTGRCVPRTGGVSSSILSCRVEPEVFECIESTQ